MSLYHDEIFDEVERRIKKRLAAYAPDLTQATGTLDPVQYPTPTGNAPGGYTPAPHTHPWSDITSTPTTLAGYGITDAYTKTESDARFAPLSHTHAAADIVSGTMATARLGSGSASSSTFLRGDQTWQAISAIGTVTSVDITAPAAGITASGGPITTAGAITLALANDLAALEALSGTGLAARTGSDAWAQRTITGTASRVSVANGSGAAGNPTIDIDAGYVGQASLTTLGTIASGVWQGAKVGLAYGGTNADLSATGGANQIVRQNSAGGAFTVSALAAADIPNLPSSIITSGEIPRSPLTTRGDLLTQNPSGTHTRLAIGSSGKVLHSDGTDPSWQALVAGDLPATAVTASSYGSATAVGAFTVDAQGRLTAAANVTITPAYTALTYSGLTTGQALRATGATSAAFGAIDLANTDAVTGALPAANGGSGQSSYAIGDLLYASGSTALSKLADVATGNALISGGVTTAPAWGKIGLTTHVSGLLPSANGGTGVNNAGTLTNASNTTITGGGTLALGGFTLTAPATGTAALRASSATAGRLGFWSDANSISHNADLVWDNVNSRLGIQSAIPTYELDVGGYARATGLNLNTTGATAGSIKANADGTFGGNVAISGTLAVTGAVTLTTKLGLASGGTNADLSATGGANQVLKQSSAGAAITVGALVAADIPSLAASIITSGTMATARLGSGSASDAVFLRGDQTWSSTLTGKITAGAHGMRAFDISGLANNGTVQLTDVTEPDGFLFIIRSQSVVAIYTLHGTVHTTTEISDPSTSYSTAAGTATSTNIYWSAANSWYELENKIGSSQNLRYWMFY